jgi:hypothetical protein
LVRHILVEILKVTSLYDSIHTDRSLNIDIDGQFFKSIIGKYFMQDSSVACGLCPAGSSMTCGSENPFAKFHCPYDTNKTTGSYIYFSLYFLIIIIRTKKLLS